jgi:deoxyribodipyrimidine photo-lyase
MFQNILNSYIMTDKYENGLFIFRRDFRVVDNVSLDMVNTVCKRVYPIFIFSPEQVSSSNKFKSNNAVQFMIESLEDLSKQIHKMGGELLCFYGNNTTVLSHIIKELNIDFVCFNIDYTPYAIKRETDVVKLCERLKINYDCDHDYYLHPLGTVVNGSGDTYQKFTPFYEACKRKHVDSPLPMKKIHFAKTNKRLSNTISLPHAMNRFTKINPNILLQGGRVNAIKQLKIAAKNIKNYSRTHNDLSKETSQLSAYIKFGCISIREVYKLFKSKHDFIRQLYWRDFYANILYSFPHVLTRSLKEKYDKIKWNNNANWFKKWCDGQTGFPIVDAAMRQLNTTGYMHNRGRLIVSSFLIKTLLINWRHGEKYFAKHLIDYDVASNNGNWSWTAGSGADSQPYFRIFNPWRQGEEYDSDCEYIKKWIPELTSVPNKDIHNWNIKYQEYSDIKYPRPICDYDEQKVKVLKMYRDAL